MGILSKISKYTEPTEESFIDIMNNINKELGLLEKRAGAIPDDSKRKGIQQAISMMQMQMMDIIDIIGI